MDGEAGWWTTSGNIELPPLARVMGVGRQQQQTFEEDGLALLGSLVGESQLRIQKFEPEIMLSSMLPLVSVELEYHAEWCALNSPSIRVYVVIIR